MKNKAITPRDEDFAQWYTDVVKAAKLAEYSNTKGCIVFEPNGYAIWENIFCMQGFGKKCKQHLTRCSKSWGIKMCICQCLSQKVC